MTSPREISRPRSGFFALKVTKGGPEVGAAIWRLCQCTVGGSKIHDWQLPCESQSTTT